MWPVVCKTENHAEDGALFKFANLRLTPSIRQKKCDMIPSGDHFLILHHSNHATQQPLLIHALRCTFLAYGVSVSI